MLKKEEPSVDLEAFLNESIVVGSADSWKEKLGDELPESVYDALEFQSRFEYAKLNNKDISQMLIQSQLAFNYQVELELEERQKESMIDPELAGKWEDIAVDQDVPKTFLEAN